MNLWKLKIVAKIILSRLPVDYRNWSKVNIFKHGDMDNYEYAVNVLKKHVIHLGVEKGRAWKGIEIGPGDGVMSALLTPIVYGGSVDLVDAGNFINKDIDVYKEHLDKYVDLNPEYNFSGLDFSQGIDGLLKSANSKYYSQGLVSLKLMNSESYNFIFSHAVFEHIRKHEFVDTIRECYRLLTPQGVMSHVVDFKDHLGGGLNNMRFSSSLWESEWFASHRDRKSVV